MKIAICGDCHFGTSTASEIFRNHSTKFFDFMFDYMKQNTISVLLQGGDLYDRRKDVHFVTIKWTKEHFYSKIKEQNIKFYTICGNHDSLYKNTNEVNSVSLLCPEDTVVIDTSPKTVIFDSVSIDFFPWINQSNEQECLNHVKNSNSEYAIGHFGFAGFPMYPGTIAEEGLDHKLFSRYTKVFSGHYHCISQQDNVLYTGTPYELTWGDCDDIKGFWILDTETGSLEHIRNPYTLFQKIVYSDTESFDFSSVTDKFIKIIVQTKTSQKKFDSFVQSVHSAKPIDVKIVDLDIAEDVSKAVIITDLVSTQVMLNSVVDNLTTTLDKSRLKRTISDVYSEAMRLSNSL